ncbi:MAG: YdcH family protein [Rhizobiaceae bacterium]
MSHTPHELAGEFPEHAALIHHLRGRDGHFLRISNEYHEVNRAIHRAETDVEPADDLHMTDMRKERMRLKDEVFEMLVRAEPLPAPMSEETLP